MCDKIFTNTEYAKSDLMNLGATEDKVNILPVGLDLKKFEIDLPKKYKTNCKLKLLTISRIAEEKGIIHAVKAVEKLIKVGRNNISYIIVGSGPSLQSIQDYIKSNKLNEYVKCVGYISNNILRNSYYKTADIIIVPSISTKDWEENQCIAIQEAGLMHIPCIASITGGLPEVVKNEITGYLIPPGDEERIAEIIIKFLDMQYKKMSEMGESAFIFTSKKYDIKSISKTILNIIKQ